MLSITAPIIIMWCIITPPAAAWERATPWEPAQLCRALQRAPEIPATKVAIRAAHPRISQNCGPERPAAPQPVFSFERNLGRAAPVSSKALGAGRSPYGTERSACLGQQPY